MFLVTNGYLKLDRYFDDAIEIGAINRLEAQVNSALDNGYAIFGERYTAPKYKKYGADFRKVIQTKWDVRRLERDLKIKTSIENRKMKI